ncbi:hypothetical protein KBB96_16280 [Luteolibacter ambystomatis]|uniref:Uncharacterized protein n=1 Tax=Luteolibacter ambystomatis TaxID=2824561 RepID=A0A975IZ00_9BACT|nr:hypothetical protein [Luteolibacter ambystomatis]QUE50413.1 hypothetical protein KBB96_16280 [Luteolibacter ambystomatis]
MPTGASDNPYATPSAGAEPPDAPASHGWKMRNARLWVANGALLPMIDPLTGGTADRMILRRLTLRLYPWWFHLLLPVAASLGAAGFWDQNALMGAITGGIMGLFAMSVVHWFLPSCHLHAFFLKPTILSRTVLSCIMMLLVAGFVFSPYEDELWWIKAVCGGTWLILYLHTRFIRRDLRCRRREADRFEIRGVHPLALAQLVIAPTTLESLVVERQAVS